MNKVRRKVLLYQTVKSFDNASRIFGNPPVIVGIKENVASLKFNRSRFFNCLDESVIPPTASFISSILREKNANIFTLEGSNHRNKNHAFTTGGDLLMGLNIIYRREKCDYFSDAERLYYLNIYRIQHFLHNLSKEIVLISLMDGATIGSGVLYGLNTTFSVATERTIWSLPEVSIGGFPDVGVVNHLIKLPCNMGKMLALTGLRLKGQELVSSGLATHFCKSEKLPQLKDELSSLGNSADTQSKVKEVLDKYHEVSIEKKENQEINKKIDKLKEMTEKIYKTDDVSEVIENLKNCDDEESKQQLRLLKLGCPLSLRFTYSVLLTFSYNKI